MKQRIIDAIKVILMLGMSVICFTLPYRHESKVHTPTQIDSTPKEDTIPKFYSQPVSEGLREALVYYDLYHPDIVYAQAVLETGYFTSAVCIRDNNLFGLYNSRTGKFYKFNHWTESVIAYKEWIQRKYKPPVNYYTFLKRVRYASDPQYINKLKIIVKREYDKRRDNEGDTIPQRV